MREVKFNKQMQQAYAHYKYARDTYHYTKLEDCYKSASVYKHRAYRQCVDILHKYNGYDFAIIGYNCHFFQCRILLQRQTTTKTFCMDYTIL